MNETVSDIIPAVAVLILLIFAAQSSQLTYTVALAQTTLSNTFGMDGAISSLVLGMPANTKTIDMTTVQKFILSGDWTLKVVKGRLTNFTADFYTGPVDGGTSNHTHQLTNFRVNNATSNPIQLSPDKSVSISGILDVRTNGKKAWNDVHTTVAVSKGRTITIILDDKYDQRHFMGQQIYGIIKRLNI